MTQKAFEKIVRFTAIALKDQVIGSQMNLFEINLIHALSEMDKRFNVDKFRYFVSRELERSKT